MTTTPGEYPEPEEVLVHHFAHADGTALVGVEADTGQAWKLGDHEGLASSPVIQDGKVQGGGGSTEAHVTPGDSILLTSTTMSVASTDLVQRQVTVRYGNLRVYLNGDRAEVGLWRAWGETDLAVLVDIGAVPVSGADLSIRLRPAVRTATVHFGDVTLLDGYPLNRVEWRYLVQHNTLCLTLGIWATTVDDLVCLGIPYKRPSDWTIGAVPFGSI